MKKGVILKEITNALNSTYYFVNNGGCRYYFEIKL